MTASITSSNWIDVASVASGNWTDATHWSTGSVPGASTNANIGPSVQSTVPWTVSVAGNQVASGLTLDMGTQGTLSIGGALSVGSVANGTVAGGTIDVASGGSFTVADLPVGASSVSSVFFDTTFQVNGGTITTGGFVDLEGGSGTLSAGGAWNADSLIIGRFSFTGMTVEGAGSKLTASSTLDIGSGALAAVSGFGSLDVTSGALVTAASLNVAPGSLLSVDSASAVDVGNGTTTAGAVDIGSTGTVALTGAKISGNVVDGGAIEATGTNAIITGTLSGAGSLTVGSGGVLEVGSAAGFSGNVTIDSGATLLVDAGAPPSGLFSMAGGMLDLKALGFGTGSGPALSYSGTMLTIGSDQIDVGAGLATADFSVSKDATTGTKLTEVACYAAGTRIAAEFGEIAVEMLRPGDLVRTAGGRIAPVAWVGHSAIDLGRHPHPQQAAPVRIEAGAFAPGLPRRDLFVSPDHAMLVDGVLIPAKRLANGASIRQEVGQASVRYVHVELDRHDLLLAEGIAAESYLDTGNRGQFDGHDGPRALHARFDGDPTAQARRIFAERGCAELVTDGERAFAAHARLAARAAALGWERSDEASVTVTADRPGAQIAAVGPETIRVTLPASTRKVRIGSRRFVPDTLTPGCGDGRMLGAALAVELDGRWLDAPALAEGWYPAETAAPWRWTDGEAVIALPGHVDSVVLTIHVVRIGATYWVRPEQKTARAA